MDENKIDRNYILNILNKEKEISLKEALKIIENYCLEHHKDKQQIYLFLNAIITFTNYLQYCLQKCLEYYKYKFNICWVTKTKTNDGFINPFFCNNQTILFYF